MNTLKSAVTSYINGDESAFAEIYAATYRRVYTSAVAYLKNPTDAEDAVQEIYIQFHQKAGTIQDPHKLAAWLGMVTRNTCLNRLEKNKRTEVTAFDNDDDNESNILSTIKEERGYHSPEDNFLKSEHSSIILDMVGKLPEDQRDVVIMHYLQQRSISDIAELIGVSSGTIKSRLNYARQKLKALVIEKEEEDGVKLRGLVIFPFLLLRHCVQTMPLSIKVSQSCYAAIQAARAAQTGVAIGSSVGSGSSAAITATASTGSIISVIGLKPVIATVAAALVLISAITLPIVLGGNDDVDSGDAGIVQQGTGDWQPWVPADWEPSEDGQLAHGADTAQDGNRAGFSVRDADVVDYEDDYVYEEELSEEEIMLNLAFELLSYAAAVIEPYHNAGSIISEEASERISARFREEDGVKLRDFILSSATEPMIVETLQGMAGLYLVESARGNPIIMIYFGDMINGSREGLGSWIDATRINNQMGEWVGDIPNGNWQFSFRHYLTNEYDVTEGLVINGLLDGRWYGEGEAHSDFSFGIQQGYWVSNPSFVHGIIGWAREG